MGILHSRALCPGILYRRTLYPRTLRRRTFYPRALCAPNLPSVFCPCSMDGQDVSVFLHEPMRYGGILRNLCRGTLGGLSRPDVCLRILLRYPGLELPEQDFR